MKLFRLLLFFFLGLTSTSLFASRSDSISITHYSLNLDFSDFTNKIMRGYAILSTSVHQNDVTGIALDLVQLTVDSVKANGQQCNFTQAGELLAVQFQQAYNNGSTVDVVIWYRGQPYQQAGDFGGFYWTNFYAFNIGVSFLNVPHNYGRVWFPCYDTFTDRATYDFSITTQSQHTAFCNGTLTAMYDNGNNTRTWYWQMHQAIPSYLASVTISNYTVHTDSYSGLNGNIPITLASSASDSANMVGSFQNLKNALSIFEQRFGPYLFDRVGYCAVPFNAGAMEHATNISYMQAVINGNTAYETLMAHELSHHWFGNLATCENAGEMWLNEGWAVYCEHLFTEAMYGPDAYRNDVRINHEDVLHLAHVDDGAYYPVSGVPETITYGSTVYKKGADVAHTLRTYMGDSLFFSSLRSYFTQYTLTDVNSAKLRDHLSQSSGLDLTNFFNDWVFAPGFPHFAISHLTTLPGDPDYFYLPIRQRRARSPHLYQQVPVTVTIFDTDRQPHTYHATWAGTDSCMLMPVGNISYTPAFIAFDFEERLSDAITDEWRMIAATGNVDFGTARLKLNMLSVTDSLLLRAEHHWIAPEPMMNPIEGLHLSDYRYWTLDGTPSGQLPAIARFDFNGSNTSSGQLDNTFITTSEDSLVMMWRPDFESEWQFADSFSVHTLGSPTNKVGYINVYNPRKGDYAMAIWDASRPVASSQPAACSLPSLLAEQTANPPAIAILPNPARNFVQVQISGLQSGQLQLCSMHGQVISQQLLTPDSKLYEFNLRKLERGTYLILLTDANGRRSGKTFIHR